jgi:nucleotide sugar dehydrogenase
MNVSIFGLGYVGSVTAAALAKQGHSIVGVDVQEQKVESFDGGIAPIVEPGLAELLRSAKRRGLLRATVDCQDAIDATELSIVCVGTPSSASGALDTRFVRHVVDEIGAAVRTKSSHHVLVLRSTMLPGSTARLVEELLSDLVEAGYLDVFFYPEFLREGTALQDFEEPSLAVVGARHGTAPPACLMRTLFGERTPVVDWSTAEMLKYACNAFHATKVTFANEVGRVAKQLAIDARWVMDMLCRDTKLNVSPYYLRPGNPFGGSCLPKDLRALTMHARINGVSVPLLESLLPSNHQHLQSLLTLIEESGQRDVVVLGLSFKAETDDLRESAMVELSQVLLGRGYRLRIYDPALNLAELVGANKRVIDVKMPHLASLLHHDLGSALGSSGTIVAAQKCAPLCDLRRLITPAHHVIDINGWSELRELNSPYQGLCW